MIYLRVLGLEQGGAVLTVTSEETLESWRVTSMRASWLTLTTTFFWVYLEKPAVLSMMTE